LEIIAAPLSFICDDEVTDGGWLVAEFLQLKINRKELLLLVSDGLGWLAKVTSITLLIFEDGPCHLP